MVVVLSRKLREEIVVPEYGLVFTILEIQGNKVRVGVAAPPHVEIHRREVWESAPGAALPAADRPAAGKHSTRGPRPGQQRGS
jgi:carbon storage regulator